MFRVPHLFIPGGDDGGDIPGGDDNGVVLP